MTTNSSPTRVVAVGDPGPTQQQIISALSSQPEFQLLDALSVPEKLARDLHASDPQVILVDHQLGGQPTLDIIDDLALQFPQTAILAILPREDPLMAQQVMLAGARAFLVQPFTQVNLLSTLRRVRDLEARRQQVQAVVQASSGSDKAQPLKTLAIYSPRGGAGTSTLAANLAIALHEETNARVLLVEGKLLFGHLGLLLNIRTHYSIADLVPHAASLEPGLVRDVVTEHISGIHVLLSPSDVQAGQGIRPQDLFNIITGLQRQYDMVVIDAGSDLNENTVTLMDASDRVLLVTNPDLASLHDTSRFVQISRTLAYPAGKLLVVLNRDDLQGGVRLRDIQAALHHELFAQIPDDGPNALRSLNRGIPMLLKYPRSPATRSIQKLARDLVNMGESQTAAAATAAASKAEKPKAGSRKASRVIATFAAQRTKS